MQALGVARRDIRLLTCRPPHDTRGDQVGGWAGPVGPNAPVGTYGGGTRLRRQGTGTYAGDSDEQRQGSWADVDRVVIVSFEDEGERSRVAGLRGVGTLLRRAELDDDAVERALGELRVGHPVVLVSVAANASNDVRVELEQGAQAA